MLTDWPIEELVGRKKFIYEVRLSCNLGFHIPFNCFDSYSKTNQLLNIGKTLLLTLSKIPHKQYTRTVFYSNPMVLQCHVHSAFLLDGTYLICLVWS